ncbi:MAG TPA: porin family protein [Patescibacteria group bacterium]|nr:porin family protein [Patescibacteria group bacterium]
MKLVLTALAGCVLCNYSAEAQITLGVKGGYSSAVLEEDLADLPGITREENPRMGITGGIFMNFTLPLIPVSIQPELLYVRKGSIVKASGSPGGIYQNTEVTTTLHYLELPVLAKFNIPVPAPVTPYIFAGPAYSYLIASNEHIDNTVGTLHENFTSDPAPRIGKNDFGITFGGGVDFTILVTKVTVDARYTFGMMNINKKDKDTDPERTVKNRTWMVMVGIAL